jgi:hypothetical protein
MSFVSKTAILVTGAPRSGTTFLGKMLALNIDVQEIEEPFNTETGIVGVDQPFVYLRSGERLSKEQKLYDVLINDLLDGKAWYKPSSLRPETKNPIRQVARNLLVSKQNLDYVLQSKIPYKKRIVIKDPNACFLSEYLVRRFPIESVVIMRHPASTVASYKRLGWRYDLEHLKNQQKLMNDLIEPYLGGVKPDKLSPVEQWSYLWLCIYSVLEEFVSRNSSMVLITHEELSINPLPTIETLYARFDLDFTNKVKDEVIKHTDPTNPVGARNNVVHDLYRNSAQNIYRWHEILDKNEVSAIRRITEPLAGRYYSRSSWNSEVI